MKGEAMFLLHCCPSCPGNNAAITIYSQQQYHTSPGWSMTALGPHIARSLKISTSSWPPIFLFVLDLCFSAGESSCLLAFPFVFVHTCRAVMLSSASCSINNAQHIPGQRNIVFIYPVHAPREKLVR